MTTPITHIDDSLKITGDHRIDLWEVQLKTEPVIYRFWNGVARTWQGQTWEGLSCTLSGEGRSAEGERSRPTLTVVNPDNIFGQLAADGYFDMATFIRRRVLQEHFMADVNIAQQNVYISTRVASVNDQVLRLELRFPTDLPTFKTPRRTYSPPEYPFVVL